MLKIIKINGNPKRKKRMAKKKRRKVICAKKNPIKIGDTVKINAPGLPGNGKTGKVLGIHRDHYQIESGPNEHKNYMHPASRLTVVRKNPRKTKKRRIRIIRARKNRARMEPTRYLIAGIFLPRRGFQKTVYFTGESFSLNRGKAKTFTHDAANSEAKRIVSMLPPKIDRIWTTAA